MRSGAVRMTLLLLALGAITAAAYLCWMVQSRTAAATRSAAAFLQSHATAVRHAHDLRLAQQAYVAAGQNETFWFGKVTEAAESLRAALATLKSSTTSGDALASLEEARAAIQDFEQIDRRARNYVSGGQQLLASDVIFSDGLDTAARIIAALDQAGGAVAQSSGAAAAAALREQAFTIASAAGIAILALLLLMPGAAAAPAAIAAAPAPEPQRVPGRSDVLDLRSRDHDLRDKRPGKAAPAGPAPAPVQQTSVEIQRVASVCTELARLSDTSLLPGILERTAAALDASGLVLWIADPDGKELLPIAAHGYAPNVLSRMGSLKAEDENATSAAFRTGLPQTVSAGAMSNGAIAVPLVTPTGCRGVMSAEVRHDAEKQPARLAAASIVAAQLATLVGPPAARAEEPNTAAL